MIGASKILTVSYGTFSCTLEGFDDPFNTMKAIAEYFRDLAAEDRYFGAEPPQPDAAMLHRIAEREVQRRVEARVQDNGVVLRAADADPAPAVPAAASASVPLVPAVEDMADHAAVQAEAEGAHTDSVADPALRLAEDVAQDVIVEASDESAALNAPEAEAESQEVIAADLAARDPSAAEQAFDATESGFAADADFSLPVVDLAQVEEAPVTEDVVAVIPDRAEFVASLPEHAEVTLAEAEVPATPALRPAMPHGVAAKLARLRQAIAAPAVSLVEETVKPAEAPALLPETLDDLLLDDLADDLSASPRFDTEHFEDEHAGSPAAGFADVAQALEAAMPDEAPAPAAILVEDGVAVPGDGADAELERLLSSLAIADAEEPFVAVPSSDLGHADDPFADDPEFDDDTASYELTEAPASAAPTEDVSFATDLPEDLAEELAALEPEPLADAPVAPVELALDADTLIAFDDAVELAGSGLPEAMPAQAAAPAAAAAASEGEDEYLEILAPIDLAVRQAVSVAEAPVSALSEDEDDAFLSALAAELSAPLAVVPSEEPDAGTAPVSEADAQPDPGLHAEEPVSRAIPGDGDVEPVLRADGSTPPLVIERTQRARARVIRIRRTDLTAPGGAAVSDAPASSPADPAVARQPEVASHEAAPVRETDEDVARLLKQTDDEMAGGEARRRHAAIQHLKAAVAATVAERKAGVAAPEPGLREDAYRADLARVVRPVRPQSSGVAAQAAVVEPAGESLEAVTPKPAPLVLVSAQRVDDAEQAPRAPVSPVRPRRIAVAAPAEVVVEGHSAKALAGVHLEEDEDAELGDTAENIFSDSRDFTEFADALGAHDLPDLLEAAAAYAVLVEKRDYFNRPMLMRRLASAQLGQALSREDGLRSFGTLLREGKIEKVGRGQYAITDASALLQEARRIAG